MSLMSEFEYQMLLLSVNLAWLIFECRDSIRFAFSKRYVKVFIKTITNKAIVKTVKLGKDNTFKALGKVFVWDARNAIDRWGIFDEQSSSMLKIESGNHDINSLEFSNVYQNKVLEWLMLVKKSTHILLIICLLIANVFITFLILAKQYGFIK